MTGFSDGPVQSGELYLVEDATAVAAHVCLDMVSYVPKFKQCIAKFNSEADIDDDTFYRIVSFYYAVRELFREGESGLRGFARGNCFSEEVAMQWIEGKGAPSRDPFGTKRFIALSLLGVLEDRYPDASR